MELDAHQHYFYDHDCEEDFRRSTAPSEDIWKKFELVATPRKAPPCPAGGKAGCPGAGERSDRLPHCCLPGEEPDYLLEPGAILSNRSASVLRDCMWSGFCARERLGKVMSEKLSAAAPRAHPHKGPAGHEAGFSSPVSECVDPAAVLPCAPAESKPGPAAPGAERPCDSEGEEIDVVTVEKRQSLSMRKPVTITVHADPLDPCMKHFHISIHQQQHNYAARSPPDTCSQEDVLEKEPKEEPLSSPERAAAHSEPGVPKLRSTPSSDSEDMAKRKNHNYLERKRRNDLRSRFQALRDQVPGLANCPKTPKVVILSKAAEYLQLLVGVERRMASEKRQLKLKQHQLLKRIAHLKGL